MKHIIIFLAACLISSFTINAENTDKPMIEVTGLATLNIIPDRITIEIGMEEYYKHAALGDSTVVKLADIEKDVRKTLNEAGVSDSLIVVSDMGNYRNRDVSTTFLMAKRIAATVSDFNQIARISDRLGRKGISSFNITKIDNSNIGQYNRQGLKSALDAARQKAEFIAENEGIELLTPYEIIETTNDRPGYSEFSNVAYDEGSGMENMRRIVRRYSVKVHYLFSVK